MPAAAGWQAVLFDLDDTLFDNATFHRAATEETLAEFLRGRGEAADPDQVFRLADAVRAAADEMWPDYEANRIPIPAVRSGRFQRALQQFGHPVLEEEAAALYERTRDRLLATAALFPGAAEMLSSLAGRRRLGIVTNGPADLQRQKVERLGLGAWIPADRVIISGEFGIAKPRREIFEAALRAVGCEADRAVFVGDSWRRDVCGALAAGLRAVWRHPVDEVPPEPLLPREAGPDLALAGPGAAAAFFPGQYLGRVARIGDLLERLDRAATRGNR